jgi:hypothetical protein
MDKITCKLFAGFVLSSEIKGQLSRSKKWKETTFLPLETTHLLEVHYQGKDYLGQYFLPKINLKDLKAKEVSMRQLLQDYCPQHDCAAIRFYVFPQIFVS